MILCWRLCRQHNIIFTRTQKGRLWPALCRAFLEEKADAFTVYFTLIFTSFGRTAWALGTRRVNTPSLSSASAS